MFPYRRAWQYFMRPLTMLLFCFQLSRVREIVQQFYSNSHTRAHRNWLKKPRVPRSHHSFITSAHEYMHYCVASHLCRFSPFVKRVVDHVLVHMKLWSARHCSRFALYACICCLPSRAHLDLIQALIFVSHRNSVGESIWQAPRIADCQLAFDRWWQQLRPTSDTYQVQTLIGQLN